MFSDLGSLAFFTVLHTFLESQINRFADSGVSRMLGFTLGISLTMATLWVMLQGYRIMTGQSRDSLIGFMIQSGKVFVILAVATAGTNYGSWVRDTINDSRDAITEIVTGSSDNVYDMADNNLLLTNTIISMVDSISTGGGFHQGDSDFDKAVLFASTFASASPAIVAGCVSLLNQIAIGLATTLGPLFILGLLFEATKPLFWNWVKLIVAVLFSNAMLAMMTSMALKVSVAYAAAVAAANFLSNADTGTATSIRSTLMQQGGLGLVLSTLLIAAPAMVMQYFNTSLGAAVSGYSPFNSDHNKADPTTPAGPVASHPGSKTNDVNENVLSMPKHTTSGAAVRNAAAGHTGDTMGQGLYGHAGRTPSISAQMLPFRQPMGAHRTQNQQQNPPTKE